MTLPEVAIFEQDAAGRRPVYGNLEIFQSDPHWRIYVNQFRGFTAEIMF